MRKVLIANRGEIAVRVVRACRDLGLRTVAVFSECDRLARHVRMADEAVAIGGNPPGESYLRIDRILDAARVTGADAVHPGYGFLSENEEFAAACGDAGLVFIGPSPDAVARLGSKTEARRIAEGAGVPLVPGTDQALGPGVADEEIAREADRVGYPLLVKAVAGGGGKGMRLVSDRREIAAAVRAARSEAASAFGDADVYLERRLTRPRHVEVQVLADHHGRVQPFVERECSIQRRHQKLLEESPSPVVSPALRARLAEAAVAVARAANYTNAGTVEFLLAEDGRFFFLEMNTRLQVEHPVTEMVTGVDLVQWQIRIARGERLTIEAQDGLTPSGHAIECRVYAEDPEAGFMPSPGRVLSIRTPAGPGIRDDGWVESGTEVPMYYDSLISKLIAWGEDRAQATARMRRALDEYDVQGVRTSIPFFRALLERPEFMEARFHTASLDDLLQQQVCSATETGDSSLEEVASLEDIAVAAACLVEATRVATKAPVVARRARAAPERADAPPGWKARARREALR
jgi:acetyl-CoA carboxylase biotin carboxylase subunit